MTGTLSQAGRRVRLFASCAALMPLMACSNLQMPAFMNAALPSFMRPASTIEQPISTAPPAARASTPKNITKLAVDIEKPEVFQATDLAMWDGRPTLGDIWVSVPGAMQPERVMIRNETTGLSVKGAMFVRSSVPNPKAPIRLSPGAARALGVAPLETTRISVTAIRKAPDTNDKTPMIARSGSDPEIPRISGAKPSAHSIPQAPAVSFEGAYLAPSENDDGYVEVAQAIDPDGASRIHDQLSAAAIPAEIQEDFMEGRSVFRVFASAGVNHEHLGGTLNAIRFAGSAQGSDDGTVIAELPNFSNITPLVSDIPTWTEMGTYQSRNEAMSVVQKLSRKAVPAEICTAKRGNTELFRIFAGPALTGEIDDTEISREDLEAVHEVENESFCLGVAAAQSIAAPINAIPASAPSDDERSPDIPDGAVRIRVGEGTGSLKFDIPNPYSKPVLIPVAGTIVSLPPDTSPELVEQIRTNLNALVVK